MAQQNQELAPAESFRVAKMTDGLPPEVQDEILDEMQDLEDAGSLNFKHIKIPGSNGGNAFLVQGDEDGQIDYLKTIDGVIIYTHKCNGYWSEAFSGGQTKFPDCASMDGKTGVNAETGEVIECATCPWNQFGTGRNTDGTQSRGKACKNMRRVYLLRDGDTSLYMLSVPPTSIKEVATQLKRLLASGIPYVNMITRFSLEPAVSASGKTYSKVKISKVGLLPPDAAASAQKMRQDLKAILTGAAPITSDDYTMEDVTPPPAAAQQTPPPPPPPPVNTAPPAQPYQAPAATAYQRPPEPPQAAPVYQPSPARQTPTGAPQAQPAPYYDAKQGGMVYTTYNPGYQAPPPQTQSGPAPAAGAGYYRPQGTPDRGLTPQDVRELATDDPGPQFYDAPPQRNEWGGKDPAEDLPF